MCFGNTETHPAVNGPSARRGRAVRGGRRERFPSSDSPLAAGARKELRGYHQPLKINAPAVASASACDLAAYSSPSGRSTPENTSGVFVPLYSRRGINAALSPACGTKSLPCGLRAHYSAKSPSAAFEPPRPSGFSRFFGSLALRGLRAAAPYSPLRVW